ncbi:chemotaxis protein CheD [Roseicyclus sp. F158]|uniref:Probable chemoreceptor glutamine deamidase CheD n=1 Tax=Tropicimonas omnivorans TaxID=3075590 RepID=A0ABU3DJP0_9RHOB|nr:chemotaxis protein CheD [Roseicyclus sp. F158]MDT0683933.1 chemotaxis protein CheD [Roseicyclus sp. F158]
MSLAASPGRLITVVQGGHAVSSDPGAIITTVLGSCVATCLHDPLAGVGGLNHILLPEQQGDDGARLGACMMEVLINALLRKGAAKHRLEAKLFGGARMVAGLSDIGERNVAFATDFLAREGIVCRSSCTGGTSGRRLRFWPVTGKLQQKRISEPVPVKAPPPRPRDQGRVELF